MGNIDDFEKLLPGRIVNPTTRVQLSTTYVDTYDNLDFIAYASIGAQSTLPVKKQRAGLGIYTSTLDLLGGGTVKTTVSDAPQAPGSGNMKLLDAIEMWFNAHQGTRDFIKHGTVWGIAYLAANTAATLGYIPAGWPPIVGVATAALIGWLAQNVHANTPWPIVGSKAR